MIPLAGWMILEFVVPFAAGIIMFCMGLELEVREVRRLFRSPRLVALALVCPLVLPPVLAFFLAGVLDLDPLLTASFVLVAACPVTSPLNLVVRLARANLALSVGVTLITNLASVVTIPTALALVNFSEAQSVVKVSLVTMALGLFAVTAAPVLLGMFIRYRWPAWTVAALPVTLRIATIAFSTGLLIAIAAAWNAIPQSFLEAGWIALVLNVLVIGVVYVLSSAAGLVTGDRVTLTLSSGTRRFVTATFVALNLCHDTRLVVPAIAYCLIMWGTALIVLFIARRSGVLISISKLDAAVE